MLLDFCIGEVSSCDLPYNDNLLQFNEDYLKYTNQVAKTCENHDLTDSMVIGTLAITNVEIDGAPAETFLKQLQHEIYSLKI